MKFDIEIPTCREGVFVPIGFAGPDDIVKTVEEAERLGFDAVWATDFLTPTPEYRIPDASPPNWYEPMIALAYCAARTRTIKLGTGVLLAPFRDPVILAKQVATLDRFSNGRMLLGLGLGMCRDEFVTVRPRTAKAQRGEILDETMEALRLLLDGNPAGKAMMNGKHVEFGAIELDPKPLQNPLPIYVPGKTPDAFPRIARYAQGVMVQAAIARDRIEGLKPVLAQHRRDIADIDVVAEGQLRLARTREQAIAAYQSSRQGQFSLMRGAKLDKLIGDNWIGTPDEVSAKIRALAEQGITHFNVLHVAGDTMQERLEQMQMFAEDVMPNVRH
jgi:probable F420-dependent oxidoreductase